MKSVSSVNQLVNRFATLINKYAEEGEVDSTSVTLAVRPIANKILKDNAPKLIENGPVKLMTTIPATGYVSVGGKLFVSADKVNNKWKITSLTLKNELLGSASENPKIVQSTSAAVEKLKAMLKPALESEFQRLSSNWGDALKINNVEVDVEDSNVTIE